MSLKYLVYNFCLDYICINKNTNNVHTRTTCNHLDQLQRLKSYRKKNSANNAHAV